MLLDVLRAAAAAHPSRPAVVAQGRTVTYADLVARAEALGRGLQAEAIERFGSVIVDPIDSIALLAAASALGVEACIYPRDLADEAAAALADRLGHDVVLVDGQRDLGSVRTLDGAVLAVAGDGLAAGRGDAPVLILTTGTTGVPKGVRHDWSRLLRTVRRHESEEDGRWLLAYNINQFAAFQVLSHVSVHGATLVVPATAHAHDAIATMREEAVTHVSATPTFWRMLLGSLGDGAPVPRLEQITLGGEAAPEMVIERLRTTFPDARIVHVYAGTEFGSAISVRDGLAGIPLEVLDRPADADVRFRVVDGELHVRSRNAMLGYHGGDEEQSWLATGDLVEARDGRLHFVGRTVEIINVAGAKVHPLPLEQRIGAVPGVVIAAVYGRPNAVTGQIVAVDVVAADGVDQAELQRAIHAACADLPAPGRPRRIRFVESIQTRGNKVVRRAEEGGA